MRIDLSMPFLSGFAGTDNYAKMGGDPRFWNSLGLTVVAEGVETDEQAAALKRLGCDELQGYLVSKPMAFEQLAELLQRGGLLRTEEAEA